MKTKHIFRLAVAGLVLAVGLSACQADMDTPELQVPEATIKANTTIRELKEIFRDKTEQVDLKDEATDTHYIIHGRVISSDATGNIYKSLVIQDETAALAFSIDRSPLYCDFRLGQEVVVDMTGLYIGYYRGLQQVGTPGDPYNGEKQLGFMAYDDWASHVQKNGLPEDETQQVADNPSAWPSDGMYCIEMTLPISTSDLIPYQSQLVELRNVHFQDGGEETYAPYQESVSRTLLNDRNESIVVRNSGYSNFYNEKLPAGKGNVRGILSYYGDSWQLLLRGPEDVMIDDKGTKDKPFTIEDALNPQFQQRTGWLEGYIVGSVKAGVNTVTGNDDIIFGADAELDNNVVIAAAPDCTDFTQCVLVELPQRSFLRSKVNLADNPGVYKKRLDVDGEIGMAMGMVALTGSKGSGEDFTIDGQAFEEPREYTEVYHSLRVDDTSCDWTFDNVNLASGLSYVWSWKEYKGKYYLNGSAYVGGAKAALAYAISPVIDLTGKIGAKASFRHAARFQTTLRQLCGFAVRTEGSTTWKEFEIPTWPAGGNWDFIDSGEIDISEFAGKKIQIAFKYQSDDSGADTWEINDVSVQAR